jgi:ketosteroid isomerase-like protein
VRSTAFFISWQDDESFDRSDRRFQLWWTFADVAYKSIAFVVLTPLVEILFRVLITASTMGTSGMKKTTVVLLLVLALACPRAQAAPGEDKQPEVEKQIWALEEAYLAYHRDASHPRILSMWHDQFLGWPDLEPQPADKKAAARRLERLYPKPASWTFTIEPAGIQVAGNVAVNYYTVHFLKKTEAGEEQKESRRVTHTWVKDGSGWRILGGMSKQQ